MMTPRSLLLLLLLTGVLAAAAATAPTTTISAFVEKEARAAGRAGKGFVSSAIGSTIGASMGGQVATVSDRENCVGCQFIWSKVNALLDQSSGYEGVKDAFERTCANMPDVFYDVCDIMFDREDEMVQMYLNNMQFKRMCDKTQICLE